MGKCTTGEQNGLILLSTNFEYVPETWMKLLEGGITGKLISKLGGEPITSLFGIMIVCCSSGTFGLFLYKPYQFRKYRDFLRLSTWQFHTYQAFCQLIKSLFVLIISKEPQSPNTYPRFYFS